MNYVQHEWCLLLYDAGHTIAPEPLYESTKLGNVQCSKTRGRVTSCGGRVARRVATTVASKSDILEGRASVAVDQGVDETQVRLTLALAVVVRDGGKSGPRRS